MCLLKSLFDQTREGLFYSMLQRRNQSETIQEAQPYGKSKINEAWMRCAAPVAPLMFSRIP